MGGVVELARRQPRPPAAEPRGAPPPDELGLLFMQERTLTAQLAETRRQIAAARLRYAARHNLLVLPSYDTLRRLCS